MFTNIETISGSGCGRILEPFTNFRGAIFKTGNGKSGNGNGERGRGNGERGTGNGERGTGNGESLKWRIFKMANL